MRTLAQNKADLVAARRSGDDERAKELSQERQQLKRQGWCTICGVAVGRQATECVLHSVVRRFYPRALAAFACLAFVAIIHAAPGLLRNSLTLVWTDPTGTNQTAATFSVNVYSSPTLAVPLTNWALLTNVSGTNLSVTIALQPQAMFFVATYSNLWGESPFSGVASAPPPPTNGTLNIK